VPLPGNDRQEGWQVQWLLLGVLGIMWAAFLVPTRRRKRSDAKSVDDFERRMELLAQAEVHGTNGRWIVTPRKGVRFLGPRERRQARARARRRRVFVVLLEAIGLALLIGIAPPLRPAWIAAAVLAGILFVYVWALLVVKARAAAAPPRPAPVERPRVVEHHDPVIEADQHVVVRVSALAAGA
jgi:Flp pilus assembly protein TadB